MYEKTKAALANVENKGQLPLYTQLKVDSPSLPTWAATATDSNRPNFRNLVRRTALGIVPVALYVHVVKYTIRTNKNKKKKKKRII